MAAPTNISSPVLQCGSVGSILQRCLYVPFRTNVTNLKPIEPDMAAGITARL